jgi:cytoskeletal protein CcmA (bactofilin family)
MGRIALFLSCLLFAGAAASSDATVRLGGEVNITEAVDGSLHAVGGRITVDAPVEGSLHAVAGRITVDAPVEGDASLAGGTITVKGPVKGDLRAAGGHVIIDGAIGGNASVAGGKLELGPDARIAGKLSFHGGDLTRDPAAVVTGAIEHTTGHSNRFTHEHPSYALGWFWSSGLIVLAALIAAALPGPTQRMALELRERPWLTTLIGLVALATIPVIAVLLMITIVGIPIALLAIIGYAALMLVGYVWLAVVVGGLLLDRVKPETAAVTVWRAGAAVLAMLTLTLLARLPFVGGFIAFVALIVGVGMVIAAVMRRNTPPETVAAA